MIHDRLSNKSCNCFVSVFMNFNEIVVDASIVGYQNRTHCRRGYVSNGKMTANGDKTVAQSVGSFLISSNVLRLKTAQI